MQQAANYRGLFALLPAAPFSQKSRASPCDFREPWFLQGNFSGGSSKSLSRLLCCLPLLFPKNLGLRPVIFGRPCLFRKTNYATSREVSRLVCFIVCGSFFPKISSFALRFSGAMVSSSEERYSASDSSICGFRGQERQNFLFFDKECLTFSAEYGILT